MAWPCYEGNKFHLPAKRTIKIFLTLQVVRSKNSSLNHPTNIFLASCLMTHGFVTDGIRANASSPNTTSARRTWFAAKNSALTTRKIAPARTGAIHATLLMTCWIRNLRLSVSAHFLTVPWKRSIFGNRCGCRKETYKNDLCLQRRDGSIGEQVLHVQR